MNKKTDKLDVFEHIEVIKSNRKSISIEIKSDLRIIVRAPKRMPNYQIRQFVMEKAHWIEEHYDKMQRQIQERKAIVPYTDRQLREFARLARLDLTHRVEHFAPIVGVDYGRIAIRSQRTRWGSCSSKGNLNFNCLLILCPEEVRNYVVVHELCHRLEMNHSPRFWKKVERVIPHYRECRKWLKYNGSQYISRLQ